MPLGMPQFTSCRRASTASVTTACSPAPARRQHRPSAPLARRASGTAETNAPKPLSQPCPCCGGRMIIIETFQRGASPRTRPAAVLGSCLGWSDTRDPSAVPDHEGAPAPSGNRSSAGASQDHQRSVVRRRRDAHRTVCEVRGHHEAVRDGCGDPSRTRR